MKNKLLLTVTSLLLASALVACGAKKGNDPTPTPGPGPVDPEPPTPPTPPAPQVVDWPTEFKPEVLALLEGFGFTDALPGIADGIEYETYGDDTMFEIVVYYNTGAEVAPSLTSYQANLLSANFTELGEDSYGDMNYLSPSAQYSVCAWDGTEAQSPINAVIVDVAPYTAPETSWPQATIEAIFADNEATLYPFPAFQAANAEFLAYEYLYWGIFPVGVEVDITGATEAEINTFLDTTLPEAGWTVDLDEGTATKTFEDLSGIATVSFASQGNMFGLLLPFDLEAIPSEGWPTEGVAELVEAVAPGSTTVVPALVSEDAESFTIDTNYNEVDVTGPASLLEEYAAILVDANWTPLDDENYVSPAQDVKVNLYYSSSYGQLWIAVKAYEVPAWPVDDAAAIVEALVPGSETVIPAIDSGEEYDVYRDAEYAAKYGYGEIDVYGDEDLEEEYADILADANWTYDVTQYGYISPAEDIVIQAGYNSTYECLEIVIIAYEAPAEEWPTEDVAALLPEDVTDTLPVFEGEATGFQLLDDDYGTAVVVYVGEGNEEAAVDSYITTLTNASYSYSADDKVYYSPNNQIMVDVYSATEGTITIEFAANPFRNAVAEFPLESFNEFFKTYLGLELESALPDAAGKGFVIDDTLYDDPYHGYRISVAGNQLEAINAVFETLLVDAGYEKGSYPQYNAYQYINDAEHMVTIQYTGGMTVVTIWE